MTKVLIAAIGFISTSAFAFPVAQLRSPVIAEAEQKLETKIGHALSDQQSQILAQAIQEARTQKVSDRAPKKHLTCFTGTLAWGGQMVRGACVHIHFFDGYGWEPTIQMYELGLVGVGAIGGFGFSTFSVNVTYNPADYDKDFDPIPGKYGTYSFGGTLGLGTTVFAGSSGNKLISAQSLNLGLHLDFSTIGFLILAK